MMFLKTTLRSVLAGTALVTLAGCGSSGGVVSSPTPTPTTPAAQGNPASTATTQLTGAGSTFDYPFFSKAFYDYGNAHGLQVNYQPIGSGGGIQQFTKKTVQFGASDVPMNASEIAAAKASGGDVVQIPVTLGAEAIAYNLPSVKQQLKFNGQTLADIYLGKVTKWNDPEIAALNPGVKLPSTAILVVHRSDGSGTTYIFSDYLSQISSTWASKVGKGKSVSWPVGVGGKGNTAVAADVQNSTGAIGYVELAYALQTKMTYGLMKNAAGDYIAPSLASATAAASQFPNVSATNFSIVNAPGAASYPIAGYSWVLLYKNQTNQATGKTLATLFQWVVTTGQKDAQAVDYAPLPANVQKLALAGLKEVAYKGTPLLQ